MSSLDPNTIYIDHTGKVWNLATINNQLKVTPFSSDGTDISDNGVMDSNNSSHTPLGIDAVFTGTATDILQYSIIFVTVFADQASATDGLVIEQGHTETDVAGIHWDNKDLFTIPASTAKTFSINPVMQYLRIRYTNGGVAQTAFRLHVVYKRSNALASSHRIQDSIVDDDDAELVKSVLTAKSDSGVFVNITATESNNLRTTDAENGLAIAKGDVTGASFVHKFGNAPDFDSGDGFVTIWDGADDSGINAMVYTYSTSADIDRIVSSSNSDTVDVEIQGLDTNYDLTVQTVTLTGRTAAVLGTSLVRVFRIKNVGSTDLVGTVSCYVDSAISGGVVSDKTKVRAVVTIGHNQTLMAVYTIPNGKTGYMRSWYASASGARRTSAHIVHLEARPFGGVFQTKHVSALQTDGTSQIQHEYIEPQPFAAKTDLEMHANTDVNLAGISAGFDIVLIDD